MAPFLGYLCIRSGGASHHVLFRAVLMTFAELNYGDVFYIDGVPFQCFKKHDRLVTCLLLDADMQHVPDPQDISGLGIKTTLYSDLRVNTNNATPRECEAYMQELKILNYAKD